MKGRYECVLTVLVFYVQAAKGYYGWCGPYDTFCLFSEGNETTVSNLSEAQLKCSEIKNDSWPVELGDEGVEEVFIEFIRNHSISNVILNAYNQNGQWHWKRSNGSVQLGNKSSIVNNIVFYGNKSSSIYSVVCMTGCRANWTDLNQTYLSVPDFSLVDPRLMTPTLEQCKEICEKSNTCFSLEWGFGCYMFKFPFKASELYFLNSASHHVVDRTEKSVDRCIGEVPSRFQNNDFGTDHILMIVLIPATISVFLVITVVITFWKWKLANRQSGHLEEIKLNTMENPYEEIKLNTMENPYEEIKKVEVVPSRYLGPAESEYILMNVGGKKSPGH